MRRLVHILYVVHTYVNEENVTLDTVAAAVQEEKKNDVIFDHLQTVPMQDIRLDRAD